MFSIWLVIAIIIFAVSSYAIGRVSETDGDVVSGMFTAAFFGSLLWPLLVTLLIVVGPFYIPYKLGTVHHKKAVERAKAQKTTKK